MLVLCLIKINLAPRIKKVGQKSMVDSCSLSLVSAQKQFFFLFILYFGDSKKQYHCNAEKGNRKNCVKKTFGKKGHFTD